MAEFGHIQAKSTETTKYTFWNVVGEPVLIVKQSGEANKPYFNERLRHAEHLQKRRAQLSVDLLQDNRARDRKLYPIHVIVGWEKVVDENGKPVPFSQEDLVGFLKVLPDEEFDDLRAFCAEARNFRVTNLGLDAAGNLQTA